MGVFAPVLGHSGNRQTKKTQLEPSWAKIPLLEDEKLIVTGEVD